MEKNEKNNNNNTGAVYQFTMEIPIPRNNQKALFPWKMENSNYYLDFSQMRNILSAFLDKEEMMLSLEFVQKPTSFLVTFSALLHDKDRFDFYSLIDTKYLIFGKPEKKDLFENEKIPLKDQEIARFADVSYTNTNGLFIGVSPTQCKDNMLRISIRLSITKKKAKGKPYELIASFFLVDDKKNNITLEKADGLKDLKESNFSEDKNSKIGGKLTAEVSKSPLSFGLSIEKGKSIATEEKGASVIQIKGQDAKQSDTTLKFAFHKEIEKDSVVIHHLDFFYKVDAVITPLMFSFEVRDKKDVFLSNGSYQFSVTTLKQTTSHVVVGAIVGYPNCGKTTLVNQARKLANYAEVPLVTTPHLEKYELKNVSVGALPPSDFVILDTRGYHFNPESEHDKKLLQKTAFGLQVGTTFSRTELPGADKINLENGVTDFVLLFFAPDLMKLSFQKGVFYNTPKIDFNEVKLKELELLYKECLNALTIRYKDEHISKKHLLVLITHTDMIPNDHISPLKDKVADCFVIPINMVFYSGTSCTWDFADVHSFRETTIKLFEEAKISQQNEFDVIKEFMAKDADYREFRRKKCKTQACQHTLVSDEQFKKLFVMLLSPK